MPARLAGVRAFGKSPVSAYLRLNRRLWRHVPASLRRSSALRAYGALLHRLVTLRATRQHYVETCFFRNRPQLAVIADLAQRRAPRATLRLAVLGCSNGAELYSVLWSIRSRRPDLTVVTHAVDISAVVLTAARRGIYQVTATDVAAEPLFARMTVAERQAMLDTGDPGREVAIRQWLKEGITWHQADAASPELVEILGQQDIVLANNFLCHLEPSVAERCLRNIARLVKPAGHLIVSGVDLDVRTRAARELGWQPLADSIQETHDGDPSVRNDWPWAYWGLEPLDTRRADWAVRYASVFEMPAVASTRSTPAPARPGVPGVVDADLDYVCGRLEDEFRCLAGADVLLTGGAGFLGYYLVQSLLSWNRRVPASARIRLTVYDNYARGRPRWLTDLQSERALTLVTHDITRPLPDAMPPFQYIVHAASIASPTYYRRHPIATMDANVNGLRSLLEFSRGRHEAGQRVRGFLFFSSSEIYGDPPPDQIPTSEEYRGHVSCTGPRACYDEAKRYGETLCVNFARHYGLPITVARPFNNYGPGLKISDRRVIPDFVRDILAERDLVMLSDGSPRRTFCYVADAVIGYYKALVRGRPGEAYNIGVEAPEISIAELAERLVQLAAALFDYRGRVVRQASAEPEYLLDNPSRRCPSIAKARTHLGFDPTISLDDGLRRSLLWYAANPAGDEA